MMITTLACLALAPFLPQELAGLRPDEPLRILEPIAAADLARACNSYDWLSVRVIDAEGGEPIVAARLEICAEDYYSAHEVVEPRHEVLTASDGTAYVLRRRDDPLVWEKSRLSAAG